MRRGCDATGMDEPCVDAASTTPVVSMPPGFASPNKATPSPRAKESGASDPQPTSKGSKGGSATQRLTAKIIRKVPAPLIAAPPDDDGCTHKKQADCCTSSIPRACLQKRGAASHEALRNLPGSDSWKTVTQTPSISICWRVGGSGGIPY
jgi:hypothetical protein